VDRPLSRISSVAGEAHVRVGKHGWHHGRLGRTALVAEAKWGADVPIGPVQLIVLDFSHPDFHGEIIERLERLRVIDALAVYEDARGQIEVEHLSNLTDDEAVELASTVGALIGLGIEGEEGVDDGAESAAEGIGVFTDEQAWDVLEDI
jgi:hypothetical protein